MGTFLFSLMLGVIPNQKMVSPQVQEIQFVAQRMQPELSKQQANELAIAINQEAVKYHLNWKILVAILAQESSLQRDPGHCLSGHAHCRDFGIAQINFHTWGIALHLSKRKLITSYSYALDAQGQILSLYRNHYSDWVGRYHSFTPPLKVDYERRINRHYAKIKKILRKFKYERYSQITGNYPDHNKNSRSKELVFDRRDPSFICVFDRPRRPILRKI